MLEILSFTFFEEEGRERKGKGKEGKWEGV
jgi:hypothetical protein